MSLIMTNPGPVFTKIDPIRVHSERFPYIEYIFNLCMSGSFQSTNVVSPAIKVGFIEKGAHVLERMFVAEDVKPMLIFIKNVPLKAKPNIYIRTAYIIVRSRVNYVHFATGSIFKDLLDYCVIENDETKANLLFYHNDSVYDDINLIIAKDPNYKKTTRIFIRSNNYEIGNDLFQYSYIFKDTVQYKIGYYVQDINYENYFHPMMNISTNFGELQSAAQVFMAIMSNPQYVTNLVNIPFQTISNDENEDTKKKRKAKFVGMSLFDKVKSIKSNQEKKISIGWFLTEIMYRFFYDD